MTHNNGFKQKTNQRGEAYEKSTLQNTKRTKHQQWAETNNKVGKKQKQNGRN